ncbi:MAG: hypothetical protein IKX31_01560 [Muribaculaceae bacterium]|nr:hypothetical protein [Muribaculaceae bacterium]
MVKETIIISEIKVQLLALRSQVEEKMGRALRLPSDFQLLAHNVAEVTGEHISTNTLKRLWGYLEGYRTSRRFTLNVLSRYVGFRDWDDYCVNLNHNASSQIFDTQHIDSGSLDVGDRLTLRWHPDRVVRLEYRGGNEYVVLESHRAKLTAGDTFKCQGFVPGQPLVINGLLHKGVDHPINYICGKQGGVKVIIKD